MRSRYFSILAPVIFFFFSAVCCRHANAQPLTFVHMAGGDGGNDAVDAAGPAARLHAPRGVALDAHGNLYVADELNHTIRRISPAGEVSTLAGLPGVPGSADGPAGKARFNHPFGIAVDGGGTLYVADSENHTVRAVTPQGLVSTLAGLAGQPGSSDGIGSAARFSSPFAVAVDRDGDVWVADYDSSTIRKIAPGGRVMTLAGQTCAPGFVDGKGDAARFNHPTAIALEPSGAALVADNNNAIRRVTKDGTVTTLLDRTSQQSFSPGLATDAMGRVYILDRGQGAVLKLTPAGETAVLAGSPPSQFTIWGSLDGHGGEARFNSPWALAVDAAGTVFVADTGNDLIRKINPAGDVTTLAGLAGAYGHADGIGQNARFFFPRQIAVDRSGNIYVPDNGNHVIRKITPDGAVTTLAGMAGVRGSADGTGSAARFELPSGVAVDPAGNVLVADSGNQTIRKITPDGRVTTLAGEPGFYSSEDGVGSAAHFFSPLGIACDESGNAYVADTGNQTIRKIMPDGRVTTLAGLPGTRGSTDGSGSAALFSSPWGIAVDGAGNVFVSDEFNSTIRKITPDGNVRTVAGRAASWDHIDGNADAARFYFPTGIATDASGNLWIADSWNQAIRMLTPDGEVTTVAGPMASSAPWVDRAYPVGPGRTDGTGSGALFNQPEGIAVGPDGTVFVAEMGNHAIRMGRRALPGDVATIDARTGPTRTPRRLDALASSASNWEWSIIRRPAGSIAGVSSPTSKTPTLMPDASDLYVFRLVASGPAGATISEVQFDAQIHLRLDGGLSPDQTPKRVPR